MCYRSRTEGLAAASGIQILLLGTTALAVLIGCFGAWPCACAAPFTLLAIFFFTGTRRRYIVCPNCGLAQQRF